MKMVRSHHKTRPLYSDPGRTGDWKASGYSGYDPYPKAQTWSPAYREEILKRDYAIGLADRNTTYGVNPYWPLGSEAISYQTGPRQVMRNCSHLKLQMVQYPVTSYNLARGAQCMYGYKRWSLVKPFWKDALSAALSAEAALPGFESQQFSARAFWSMRPKFKSEASLINTIFELKDFKDVFPSLAKNWRQIQKSSNQGVLKTLKKVGSSVRATPLSAVPSILSKVAASAVLTWNLAVKPTIQDAMTIHATAQQDIYKLAKEFNELGEEGARSHYSERENVGRTMTRRTNYDTFIADGSTVDYKRTATAIFYQRLLWEKLENAYPRWWGLEIGADEVWNMLPLSFVLDYIFTVGKSLEFMDRDDRVEAHVVQYCESIKIVASMGTYVIHDSLVPALAIDGVVQPINGNGKPLLVSGTQASVYRRKVMDPYNGPALPRIKVPSASQGINMLALARCFLS